MSPQRITFTILLACLLAGGSAAAGSIRYELPTLLGEHRYDGTDSPIFGRFAFVDTPFGFYDVAQARLVVEGRVTAGKARGDGVLVEDHEFDLLPSVGARPSFSTSSEVQVQPTPALFRLEQLYPNPFVPETTPLPNPDGYPPVSFFVHVSVGPSLATSYPPLITPPAPGELVRATDGVIVLEPIIAEITSAYIVLSGPGVVPAPGGLAVVVIACAGLLMTRRRFPSALVALVACALAPAHADTLTVPLTPSVAIAPDGDYLSADFDFRTAFSSIESVKIEFSMPDGFEGYFATTGNSSYSRTFMLVLHDQLVPTPFVDPFTPTFSSVSQVIPTTVHFGGFSPAFAGNFVPPPWPDSLFQGRGSVAFIDVAESSYHPLPSGVVVSSSTSWAVPPEIVAASLTIEGTPIPEPGTLAMLAMAAAPCLAYPTPRRRCEAPAKKVSG